MPKLHQGAFAKSKNRQIIWAGLEATRGAKEDVIAPPSIVWKAVHQFANFIVRASASVVDGISPKAAR